MNDHDQPTMTSDGTPAPSDSPRPRLGAYGYVSADGTVRLNALTMENLGLPQGGGIVCLKRDEHPYVEILTNEQFAALMHESDAKPAWTPYSYERREENVPPREVPVFVREVGSKRASIGRWDGWWEVLEGGRYSDDCNIAAWAPITYPQVEE